MIDDGIFRMKTVGDLFQKLQRDYARILNATDDSEAWFNFIVTADHMPEWLLGGDDNAATQMRKRYPLLRICHHLSVYAKHVHERPPKPGKTLRLSSVERTHEAEVMIYGGPMPPSADAAEHVYERTEFELELSADEAKELGRNRLSTIELARMLVEFWRNQLNPLPSVPPSTNPPA